MLHKVIALNTYEELKVSDKDLGKILPQGFEFEVDDDRLDVLLGNNGYHVAFVKIADEKAEEKSEESVKEVTKPRRRKQK